MTSQHHDACANLLWPDVVNLLLAVHALARDLRVRVVVARRACAPRQPQEVQVTSVARAVGTVGRQLHDATVQLVDVTAQRDDCRPTFAACLRHT